MTSLERKFRGGGGSNRKNHPWRGEGVWIFSRITQFDNKHLSNYFKTFKITYQYRTLWKWRSPLYVLAVNLPMFVLTRLAKRVFFPIELIVLAVYIAPFLSQSNKTLQYFQILASLVNRTLFPWSLWKLCSMVDFTSAFIYAPAETTKLSSNQPHSIPRGSVYAFSIKRSIMRYV